MNGPLSNILSSLADGRTPVSEDDVLSLAEAYPFFTLPAVMLLGSEDRGELSPDTEARLKQLIALNAPDARSLAILADPAHRDWLDFYPAEEKSVTTDSVITTFLETYGRTSPKEEALLERLIFNPTPDYSTILAREEEENLPEKVDPDDNSQDALINSFILSRRGEPADRQQTRDGEDVAAGTPAEPMHEHPQAPASGDNSSLTESLAKIYIRQKRFDKAFEIIHTLSLKNPKKSAYFADQLRFLRKLMLVQQLREQ